MKDYFFHPSDLRNSSEMLRIRRAHGPAGYGIALMLLEILRDNPNYTIPFDPEDIAYNIRENDSSTLIDIIQNYNFFSVTNDNELTCPWLIKSMLAYDEKKKNISEARSRAAAARWEKEEKKQSNSNSSAWQMECNCIPFAKQEDTTNININKSINPPPNPQKDTEMQMERNGGGGNFHDWKYTCAASISKNTLAAAAREIQAATPVELEALTPPNDGLKRNMAELRKKLRALRLSPKQCEVLCIVTNYSMLNSADITGVQHLEDMLKNKIELNNIYQYVKDTNFSPKYPFNYILSRMTSYNA